MKIYTSRLPKRKENHIVLYSDDWDDYTIKATFRLSVILGNEEKEIGEVKIINKNKKSGRTSIEEDATLLSEDYCSLGQSVDYYKALHRLGTELEHDILLTLRDCAYDGEIYENFKDLSQFISSAVRFSTAEQALKFGQELHSKLEGPTELPSYSFDYKTQLEGFAEKHELKFEFFDGVKSKIPSNINVLIGRNGTGKTQLLSDLAKAISGYGYNSRNELLQARAEKFPSGRPGFGNVIVVSYSAFDSFEIPGKNKLEQLELARLGHIFGYKYCGLRERIKKGVYRIKTSDEVAEEFQLAVQKIKRSGQTEKWEECLQHVLNDPCFEYISPANIATRFSNLSSGQKIILSILAKIYQHIEPSSFVIIDEPETHLHPSLIASLLHALRDILNQHESYALIATHSPVILQETPSKFVQVLGGNIKRPMVKRLKTESFGEEISTLTEEAFGVSFEESNFYGVLQKLAKAGLSLEEINNLFGKKLGLTARSFVANAYH